MRFKFLALVLVSAVAVSSTSTFAHTHKRTHHRSFSNSMNMMKGSLERQPRWIPTPGFQTDSAAWGGGSGGGGGAMRAAAAAVAAVAAECRDIAAVRALSCAK